MYTSCNVCLALAMMGVTFRGVYINIMMYYKEEKSHKYFVISLPKSIFLVPIRIFSQVYITKIIIFFFLYGNTPRLTS